MPENPEIWIALIVAAALVALLAIILGRRVGIDAKKLRLSFQRGEGRRRQIDVLGKAELENAVMGDVTGIRAAGPVRTDAQGPDVSVMSEVKATRVRVGDITGLDAGKLDGARPSGPQSGKT